MPLMGRSAVDFARGGGMSRFHNVLQLVNVNYSSTLIILSAISKSWASIHLGPGPPMVR